MKKESSVKNKTETKKIEDEEQKEEAVVSEKDGSAELGKDPTYKAGKRLYDIGLALFSVMLILNLTVRFMNIEIFIGGFICTRYIIFLYLIPDIMMIAGLMVSNKAQKRLKTNAKGDRTCFIISVLLAAFIVFGGTFEAIFPSYHVYEIENVKASDGREFVAVKNETVNMFGERHDKMPTYYNIDIYDVNGIFAKRLISCPTYDGKYNIEKTNDGKYKLNLSFLGREEGYPFEG